MASLSGQTAHRLADVADPYCPGMEAFAIDPDELATALQRGASSHQPPSQSCPARLRQVRNAPMLHCFVPVGHYLAEYETRTVISAPHAVSPPLLGDDVEKTCG